VAHYRALAVAVALLMAAALYHGDVLLRAQERMPPVRTWIVAVWDWRGYGSEISLRIFDLSGACVYIVQSGWDNKLSVTVLSKRELAPGVGVVGEFVVGQRRPFNNVSPHRYLLLLRLLTRWCWCNRHDLCRPGAVPFGCDRALFDIGWPPIADLGRRIGELD